MHWFHPNDLSHCVNRIARKYVIAKLLVPTVWPIQEGTDLIKKEVTTFFKMGFFFYCNHAQSLFGSQSFNSSVLHVLAMSVHNIVQSVNASCWPTTCGGKKVRRPSIFKITQQHTNNWEASILLPNALFSPC
jgi:hypothetical protein